MDYSENIKEVALSNPARAAMAKCGGCGIAARVDGADAFTERVRFPPAMGRKLLAPAWASCWACGGALRFSTLKATLSPSTKCDHRCTRSKGATCICSCGGANHGTAL
jgi:hypothetical protein